jgi:ligand-binding sensor domain-containing protein
MPDNSLWIGTDPGLMRWEGGKLTQVDTAGALEDKRVWALLMNPDGKLWAGTSHGLFSFDGQAWTQATAFEDRTVTSLVFAADGALWAGSWGGGAARFDGNTWQTFTTQDGLFSNIVHALRVASDGSAWIAGQAG